jgi:hypothetical protein
MVVNDKEKMRQRLHQVRVMETNESELPMRCRNRRDDVETGGRLPTGINLRRKLNCCASGVRHRGGVTMMQARVRNVGTWSLDAKGEARAESIREGESTEARRRGGAARSSEEAPVMGVERRGCIDSLNSIRQPATGGAR